MLAELRVDTYAPLYWATSSPSTNTLSLDWSSSARASFRASLTATSFTPLGVAYLLRFAFGGNEAEGCRTVRVGATKGREDARRREAGRRRREVTMARAVDGFVWTQGNGKGRYGSYKIMLCVCRK